MAPAAAILVVRHLRSFQNLGALEYGPLLAAAGVSILITIADCSEANCARTAARLFQERYRAELGKVWVQGHGGFQYYMEQWGAKPFDRKNPEAAQRDLLIGLFSDRILHNFRLRRWQRGVNRPLARFRWLVGFATERAQVSIPACTARCPG